MAYFLWKLNLSQFKICRYFLQPRSLLHRPTSKQTQSPASARGHSNSLGSLRLNIQYTADHVFSSHVYNSLRELLLQSINAEVCNDFKSYSSLLRKKLEEFLLFSACNIKCCIHTWCYNSQQGRYCSTTG